MKYKISDLAKITKVSTANIRFYEKSGLLPKAIRQDNNYRFYSEDDVHTLNFIKMCRYLDMSLEEVKTLLNLNLSKKEDCKLARDTIYNHYQHVEQRIKELKELRKLLAELDNTCSGGNPKCKLLTALHNLADSNSWKNALDNKSKTHV